MKSFKCSQVAVISMLLFLSFSIISCSTKKKVISDDSFATESTQFESGGEELSMNEEGDDLTLDDSGQITSTPETSPEEALENELNAVNNQETSQVAEQATEQVPAPEIIDDTPAVGAGETAQSPPEMTFDSSASADLKPSNDVAIPSKPVVIKNLQFKSNDSGGAFVITADTPIQYTTRVNASTQQVILEAQNVVVPSHLKRPFLTKDMKSTIGSVDVYQKKNSNIARFVIQLRPQAGEPLIQPEGNSLVVLGAPIGTIGEPLVSKNNTGVVEKDSSYEEASEKLDRSSILNTQDLEDYLANNSKFNGKKISIEANDLDIRYVLNLISEESGVNLILDNDVNGTVSVKLRKVPWDQALVLVLKASKLTYRRQGNVLRVLTIDSLRKEDEMALQIMASKETVEPLTVKSFAINYANVKELGDKISAFLADIDATTATTGTTSSTSLTGLAVVPNSPTSVTSRSKVVYDEPTGMLIVTATKSKLAQVDAMIKSLDVQPQQVMIEARIIEASETFNKSMGVSWGLNRGVAFGNSRTSTSIGNPWADPEPINMSPSIGYTSKQSASGSFGTSLWLGKLGVLGDLDTELKLEESEDRIKIISSPRVTVISNKEAKIKQTVKIKTGTSTAVSNGIPIVTDILSDVGVDLTVTPQVSNLGTVKMKINVTRGGTQAGGGTNDRSMSTDVIVKSGSTFVIGGVFQSDVLKSKSGVPGLKDIPILGTLFKGEATLNQKTELMVFVTPKILDPVVPVLGSDTTTDSTFK